MLVVLGNTIISQLKTKYNNLNPNAIESAFIRQYVPINILGGLYNKKHTVSVLRGRRTGLKNAIKPNSRNLKLPLHDYMNSPEVLIPMLFSLHTPKRTCLFK